MLKFCCTLLGEDFELLKNNTPKSRKKIFMQSTALLVPVIIWTMLGFMIVNNIMKHGAFAGFLAALACGTTVFALERMILMGNGHWSLVLTRIVIAGAVAALGAIFIDQLIFKSDIDQELSLMKQEQKDSAFKKASASLTAELISQNQNLKNASDRWINAQDNMVKEADASGGTRTRGIGAVTILKAGVSNRMEVEYENAKRSVEQLKGKHDALRSITDAATEANFNTSGLLLRTDALDRLYDKSSSVRKVFWLVTIVFFFLEFMVVIAKFSMKKTSYEMLLETQEHIAERRQKHIMSGNSPLTQPERMDPGMAPIKQKLLGNRPGMFN